MCLNLGMALGLELLVAFARGCNRAVATKGTKSLILLRVLVPFVATSYSLRVSAHRRSMEALGL